MFNFKKLIPIVSLLLLTNACFAAGPKYKSVESGGAEDSSSQDGSSTRDYFKAPAPQLPNDLFVGLGIDFFDSFGVQGRYAVQVLEKGLIPDVSDAIYIEGGFGMTFYGTVKGNTSTTGFNFLAAGRWDFFFNKELTFFGTLGLGYNAITGVSTDAVKGGGIFPAVGVGAMYNFTPEWAARADLSYQFLGVGIVRRF